MEVNSRKELKGLIDWYDELMGSHKYMNGREVIPKIYQNYKTTTFNEEENAIQTK